MRAVIKTKSWGNAEMDFVKGEKNSTKNQARQDDESTDTPSCSIGTDLVKLKLNSHSKYFLSMLGDLKLIFMHLAVGRHLA